MLSPVRIMQYFKNSICIKGAPTQLHNFRPPNWAPLNKRATSGEKKNENPGYIDQFYKFFTQPPQICVHAKLANNRISNVWRMISPKKSRQFSFQLIPPCPGPDHSCIGIKCSYHLFYVFFFRARLLGWQTSLFPPEPWTASHGSMQIFKLFCIKPSKNWKKKKEKLHCGRV